MIDLKCSFKLRHLQIRFYVSERFKETNTKNFVIFFHEWYEVKIINPINHLPSSKTTRRHANHTCDSIYSLLAPSGTLVFIMVYYIPAGHFSKVFKFGAILPIYIHNSLSLSFSVHCTEQNQAILLHELH